METQGVQVSEETPRAALALVAPRNSCFHFIFDVCVFLMIVPFRNIEIYFI